MARGFYTEGGSKATFGRPPFPARPRPAAPRPSALRARPPERTRRAIAVAAFGRRLRGDPWLGEGSDWDAVLEQARGARGEDPYGDRTELVQMIRAAQGLPARTAP